MVRKVIRKIHLPNWLIILLVALFVLRIPSFFEPFSYGDEMIYLTLGEAARRGLTLFRDIHDNKPPLLYFLAAVAGNVFWFRAILAGWMLATTVLFWKLVKTLFPKNTLSQKIATIIFGILTTIPLLEGQIANAELFMIGPIIGAFIILLQKTDPSKKGFSYKKVFLAGTLFSLATLFKVPAAFDMGAIVFLWLLATKLKTKSIQNLLKATVALAAGFIIPILATMAWYYLKGAFNQYLIAAFLQNVGYLSSWQRATSQEPFLVKNAPLLMRGGTVMVTLLVLFLFRKRLTKQFIFASAWLAFSLFATTLSERPYPHYLIQAVPSVAILIGILVSDKTIEQSLTVIPLFVAVFVPIYYKFWYYPTFSYYSRFLSFAAGQISKRDYFDLFDGAVNRNYEVAEFIVNSTRKSDKIFVWGDSPPIYALTKRLPPLKYVATYHINDFSTKEEVMAHLTSDQPIFIIILSNAPSFPDLYTLLNKNYILIENIKSAQIWRLLNPKISEAIR